MANRGKTSGTQKIEKRFKLADNTYARLTGEIKFSAGVGVGAAGVSVEFSNARIEFSGAFSGYIGSIEFDFSDVNWSDIIPDIEVSGGVGGIIGFIAHADLEMGFVVNSDGELGMQVELTGGAGVISGTASLERKGNLDVLKHVNEQENLARIKRWREAEEHGYFDGTFTPEWWANMEEAVQRDQERKQLEQQRQIWADKGRGYQALDEYYRRQQQQQRQADSTTTEGMRREMAVIRQVTRERAAAERRHQQAQRERREMGAMGV